MSYSIIYKKLFLRIDENNCIPMFLSGSNNCWDVGSNGRCQRRARDWYNQTYHTKDKIWDTLDAILAHLEEERQERLNKVDDENYRYTDKGYGWHTGISVGGASTGTTTFAMYRNLFVNGFKEALTVEQLREQGVATWLTIYRWTEAEFLEAYGKTAPDDFYPETSAELVSKVQEWKEFYGPKITVSVRFREASVESFLERRKRQKRKSGGPKQMVEVEEFWALKCVDLLTAGCFFVKNTKYGYRYAYNAQVAKKFFSEKEAITFHRKMSNKAKFEVENIKERAVKWVPASTKDLAVSA